MNMAVQLVPILAAHWEGIGYRLGLRDEEMDIIEQTMSVESGNKRTACTQVMKTWIRSAHGREPKTWRTFLLVLQELGIDRNTVVEVLQREV